MRRTGSVWRCDSAELLREKFLPQKGLQTLTHDTATICRFALASSTCKVNYKYKYRLMERQRDKIFLRFGQ